MNKILFRSVCGGAVAAAAATALIVTMSGSASAAPGDPITGGTTTLAVPQNLVVGGAAGGIVAIPTTPASVGLDQTAKAFDYEFPVSGGDGSAVQLYGSVDNAGGLLISDARTHRSTQLNNPVFSFDTLQVTFTPSGSTTPVTVLDLSGSNTFSGTGGAEQTFTDDKAVLDAAGAAYLDKALNTSVFKAGQSVGTFTTDFTNTQY